MNKENLSFGLKSNPGDKMIFPGLRKLEILVIGSVE